MPLSQVVEDDVPKETRLVHPAYGLKEMEAAVYKSRPPRKNDDTR